MSPTPSFDPDLTDAHAPFVARTPAPPPAPTGYAIKGELGRGGMGAVSAAVQTGRD